MLRFRLLFTRRATVLGALVVAALVLGGGMALARAGAEEDYAQRITLARDVVKLGIVVMANQTPITAADAKAVLPVLQAIRTPETMTEELAARLDEQLLSVLSPAMQDAVKVVRLPEPRPEARERALEFLTRRHIGNPAKYGPGSRAFDRLVEFFSQTAAVK